MTAVIKTYMNVPVWKQSVASCNICMTRNMLITKNNITFVPRKLSASLTKNTSLLSYWRLHIVGSHCRFASAQSSKQSVPLSGKYPHHYLSNCYISAAVAVGLLVGWTVLELHQRTVRCVAEATETAECRDSKEPTNQQCQVLSLEEAIYESDQLLQRVKLETNSPGLVVAVTVDGKEVWTKGYGVSDLENLVECKPASVMRIASISKPLTMVAIAQLWERGKLDLDKPVQHYVASWPDKVFKGQKVTITSRHLVSMLGGIRHYDKSCHKEADRKKETPKKSSKGEKVKDENLPAKKSEFDHEEYYIKRHYSSITAALDLFKDDELCSVPGTEYLYSTYAWTLLSAVVEGASGRKFTEVMKDVFRDLGLENTYLDEDRPVIPHRSRYYVMDKQKQRLVNAPYVDNSYKWAGGGFLSTVHDTCHFGNALLYSYQWVPQSGCPAGFLRPDTVQMMWSPVPGTRCTWDSDASYGMGWCVVPPGVRAGFSRDQRMCVSHTGGAVGVSSVLLILPRAEMCGEGTEKLIPRGVCVSIIVNKQSVGLSKTALTIARLFDCVQ